MQTNADFFILVINKCLFKKIDKLKKLFLIIKEIKKKFQNIHHNSDDEFH